MKEALSMAIVFFVGYLSGGIVWDYTHTEDNPQTSKPTTYQATCTDGIFDGEVIKKGKKYYLESGQEIWIPLKECVLIEI